MLCLGIGGGGDAVGALATADLVRTLGTRAVVGGTTWERRVVDPLPGPRRLAEVEGARALGELVALAGPRTTGPGGFSFAEARLAGVLGEDTVLVDPNGGPRALGRELVAALDQLGCDAVAMVDVGGDALAHGDEPGLASPLCDAVLVAAADELAAAGVPCVLGIVGAGCDGELTPNEVLARVSEVAAGGGFLGAWGITPATAERMDAAVAAVPTEASAAAVRCARGERGTVEIRGGRRTVQLTAAGALTFYLDPGTAMRTAARLAAAVRGAADLDEAHERLAALGVRSELDLEREAAS